MKRKVYQYDLTGNKLNEFSCPIEAEQILKLHRGSVSASCNRNHIRAGNYIFRYADDCDDLKEIIKKSNFNNGGISKKVYQYDLNGDYIKEWNSINEAKRILKIKSNIGDCCINKIHTCGGYRWSFQKMKRIPIYKDKKRMVKYSLTDFCTDNPSYKYLINEWSTDNTFTPADISYKSNKKVSWKCERGHTYQAFLYSRIKGTGCRECQKQRSTSFAEQAIYYYISKSFNDAINRYQNLKEGISEIDIYIPSLKLGIEYDGSKYHRDIQKDIKKNKICNEKGITLIRIREKGLPKLKRTKYIYEIKDRYKMESLNDAICYIFDFINCNYNNKINIQVDVDRDAPIIRKRFKTLIKENSILEMFPELAKEWDYNGNKGIGPEMFTAFSGEKVNWICPKCGNHYCMAISNRTNGQQNCPVCGQEKSRQAKLKIINQYDLNGKFINSYLGAKEASKNLNIKYHQNINSVCQRKQKTAGGYIWRYADDCDDMK